jgi:YD repeat-containing protein
LLTGSATLYRQQVEEMDGSVRIDSSRESVSYRYDAAGRLVEHKKLMNGREIYRIYYRYNAAGQVDSIAEKRDKEPVLCFQLSYTTTSDGNTEVSYKEINFDLGISASSGRFSFSPEGRLLLYTCGYNKYYENYPSKFPRLQILYIFKYDSYGNWIECKRQYNNPPRIKEWEDFNLFRENTTIRKISYH